MTLSLNRWRFCVLTLILMIFIGGSAVAQSSVTLETYTDNLFGIQSLRPADWLEVADGTYSINAAPDDFGILIAQSLPGDKASLLNLVQTQFGIDGFPDAVPTETDFLTWDVYALDVMSPQVGVYRMDMALAERDGVAYLLMLQTSQAQYATYHAAVFEEVLAGFAPLVDAVQPPPPYTDETAFVEQELVFSNPEMPLGATLTVPVAGCPCPAVVLVHDAGAQDRDATILALRPFRDIAYGLASRGIATLRYDKRTLLYPDMGESFTVDDEITNDALAAVEVLRGLDNIDAEQIYVAGHGLGGAFAPRIAAQDGNLAGIIMLAAPARNYEDVLADQANYLISMGGRGAQIASDLELVEGIARIRAGEAPQNVFLEPLAGYYLSLTAYNQLEAARTLQLPMLILQGDRDYQSLTIDFEIWQGELAEKENVEFIHYPDLQHTFMAPGLLDRLSVPADYEGTGYVDETVINDIASWIVSPQGEMSSTETATIDLIAFESEVYGIQGLVPASWSELAPGTYSRGQGAGDAAILLQQTAPGATVEDVAAALLPSLQIDALPESVETVETDSFTWELYQIEVAVPGVTIIVDLAFAETDAATYLLLLQSDSSEYSALHEAIFLPALEAFSLLTAEADDTASSEAPDEARIYTDPQGLFTTTIPDNWMAVYEDDYGYLTDVDEGIRLYLLAVEASPDDMEQALVDAWLKVNPEFDMEYTEDDVIEIEDAAQLTLGDVGLAIIYEDGTGGRVVTAGAEHKDGTLYMSLTDADLATLQRRASQYQIIATSITLADAEPELDLSDLEPVEIDDDFIATLEAYITEVMTELETPGATVAIVRGDEVIYKNGFGVKVAGEDDPVDADTLMMMGSTTKPMTTTLMAMLVDDGAMDWDVPAQEILPEFSVQDETLSETITVANLVCACTGVPRRDFELLFNASDLSAEGIVDSLATFEFFTDFGEAFQYSNQLVATGGYVAAAAGGAEYGNLYEGYVDLLQSRFLDPLAMANTTFDFEIATATENYATPHAQRFYRVYEPIPLAYEEAFAQPIAPAGGLWSTVEDMAQFMILHLNNGVAADGTRLVSDENLLRTREASVPIDADTSYGLGWFIQDYKGLEVISHGGNMLGYTSDFAFVPELDMGIVVLSNQQGASLNAMTRLRFLELLYGLDPEISLPTEEEKIEREENLAEAYENTQFTFTEDELPVAPGEYTTDALGDFTLSLNEDGEMILDSGEYQFAVVLRTDPDTEETRYLISSAPLPGTPVNFNDDGTFTIGFGVIEYAFTPVE